MKKIINILILLPLILSTACEDYLGGDTNIDPNKVNEVSLNALLPSIIDATADNHYSLAFSTSQLAQQVASATATSSQTDIHQNVRLSGTWTGIYLRAMSNAKVMIDQAAENESPYYSGIGKVLLAINLGLATDTWGDVPYSEAFQASEDLTPKFDEARSIYDEIFELLDEAIIDLEAENSLFSPSDDDLIYGGEIANWIKLAHSLKARYALHLSNIDESNLSSVITSVGLGLDNNADDFQYGYDERNLNPWHRRPALANGTGNASIAFSEQLVGAMNGDDFGVFDPRLPIIADNGENATWEGTRNGSEDGGLGNTGFTVNTWYSTASAPILMLTYAELKLMEAEALFRQNGGTISSVGTTQSAYDAYLEGIEAHMMKLGVAPSEMEAYLADPNVDVGVDNLSLSLIMKEKYIATFLNPEAWVDLRRWNYSNSVYPDLDLPLNQNPELNGQWIRRSLYPLDELSRNSAEVSKVQKALDVKLFWDTL